MFESTVILVNEINVILHNVTILVNMY